MKNVTIVEEKRKSRPSWSWYYVKSDSINTKPRKFGKEKDATEYAERVSGGGKIVRIDKSEND